MIIVYIINMKQQFNVLFISDTGTNPLNQEDILWPSGFLLSRPLGEKLIFIVYVITEISIYLLLSSNSSYVVKFNKAN